jgi:outer membrane protein
MRRSLMTTLAILAIATTAGLAQAQQPTTLTQPTTMTLDEVVRRAVLSSPQIAQASGALQTSETAERSAIGAFLPNLNLSSNATRQSSNRYDPSLGTTISGQSDSYSAGLSTSLDLFTGGRRGADLDRTRAQTDAYEAALVEQRYAVTRNAKASYYDVLRGADLIRSAEARLTRAQQVLEAAQRRTEVGSGTRSDLLRAQLEVTNSRQALLVAQNQKRNATYVLGRVVGVDGPVDAADGEPVRVVPLELSREQLLELVHAASPAVLTARANEAAAAASVRAARSQYLPTLSSSGNYNMANRASSFGDFQGSWNVRLSMSFPVFNRFQREETIERAQVQSSLARIQVEDTRRLARVNLERVLGGLETAALQIALAEEALEVADEDARVQQERYRLGVSTILDQVTSQENIVQAEAALIAARYDYQLARAELEALIGRDL